MATATWRKVIVSGSNAQLATVTASVALQVGTNQYITTSPTNTYLSGSFSGSFFGNGSGLTNVTATAVFPTNAKTDLATTDQIYINDGANKYVTYGNLVTDLAGSGQATSNLTTTDTGDSLALTSQITITGASGSFSGSFFGNGNGLTNILYSSLTSIPNGIVSGSSLASSTQGQVTLTTNNVAVITNLNSLQATDSPTFANVNANAASFGLATSTATAIQIGDSSATITIPGNLTVNGTTTVVNTTNTVVKDQFILLNSGSTGTTDGGIIVGNSATINIGEALYWENNPATTGRWSIASGIDATSTSITANSYLVTVSGSTVDPGATAAPTYGGSTNGIGNMYVNTQTNDIWIWA